MLTPKKCGDCEGEETASHKSGLKTFCPTKNLEENLWADGRKSAKGTNYKPKIRYFVSLTKKDKDDVWFKFYFWQVWSALLWAASSKPLQMLPFDPLCLKSLSHFSLKQWMKDLFSVIELIIKRFEQPKIDADILLIFKLVFVWKLYKGRKRQIGEKY